MISIEKKSGFTARLQTPGMKKTHETQIYTKPEPKLSTCKIEIKNVFS